MPGAGFRRPGAPADDRGYRTRRPNTPACPCATASLRRIACWVHEPPCRDKDSTRHRSWRRRRCPRSARRRPRCHGVLSPVRPRYKRCAPEIPHDIQWRFRNPIVVTLSPEHRSRTLRRHRTFAQWRVSSPTQVSSRQPASARRAGDAGPQRTILQPRCRLNLWPPSASPMAERRAAMSRKKPDGGHRLSAAGPPTTHDFAPAPDVQLDRSRVPSAHRGSLPARSKSRRRLAAKLAAW